MGAAGAQPLTVPERAQALAARRQCLQRARDLWDRVVAGGRHGLVSALVLGALAGVRPLGSVIGRAPRPEWLERLVDALVEARLDRGPIARSVNRALEASLPGPGRAPRTVRPGHVGVLATRFRQAVLVRRPG
jgi:hypothetical protein